MRPCGPYPTCLPWKVSYMLRFLRWLGFYLKVFTEQYFVGWRFAYPTCLPWKVSHMLRFVRWLSFYLKVFTEQYFVGWRFAYPTYKNH